MNQLIWRLHRQQVLFAGAALAVLAVVLAVTGTTMAAHYHSALKPAPRAGVVQTFLANCSKVTVS